MSTRTIMDPDSIRNPGDGLFARNPTRLSITENAKTQQDIVKAVKGTSQRTGRVTFDYSDIDKKDPPPLMGILSLREFDEAQLVEYFRCLLRSKPNIIKLHLILGDYPSRRRVDTGRTNALNSDERRFNTEIADRFADVFNDKAYNVTEVIYTVDMDGDSYFLATSEVYGVSDEEYANDELFAPAIGIEYLEAN